MPLIIFVLFVFFVDNCFFKDQLSLKGRRIGSISPAFYMSADYP